MLPNIDKAQVRRFESFIYFWAELLSNVWGQNVEIKRSSTLEMCILACCAAFIFFLVRWLRGGACFRKKKKRVGNAARGAAFRGAALVHRRAGASEVSQGDVRLPSR